MISLENDADELWNKSLVERLYSVQICGVKGSYFFFFNILIMVFIQDFEENKATNVKRASKNTRQLLNDISI